MHNQIYKIVDKINYFLGKDARPAIEEKIIFAPATSQAIGSPFRR